jgi:hypothetical protein
MEGVPKAWMVGWPVADRCTPPSILPAVVRAGGTKVWRLGAARVSQVDMAYTTLTVTAAREMEQEKQTGTGTDCRRKERGERGGGSRGRSRRGGRTMEDRLRRNGLGRLRERSERDWE